MKIPKQFVEKLGRMYNQKPCNDGYKWFVENFPNGAEHEDVFQKAIDDGVISYCTWALAHSMPREKNVEWAIWCAEQVLSVFEEKYPDDDRPRKAIEAAKSWLNNHCEETRKAAWAAEAEAAAAAWTAAKAAEKAAWAAAAWTAAKAAEAAAWTAEAEAEDAAAEAAWTAEDAAAAWTAAKAAEKAAWANPDLSMQILKKGFKIWRRK